ncbi:MAG TPA: hypothetical protein VLA00_02670 [Xanthobacteraceae bacterium]|nr:hypothetical protein [Xanthobacteraceae bacterium]
MNSFAQISAVMSMVLGLGITRMLSGAIAAFRSRQRTRIDWLPLTWACIIFLVSVQFWWAINHIPPSFAAWTFESLVGLTAFTGLLFVAAALILPGPEAAEKDSLQRFFEAEGRWSLLFLAIFNVASVGVNVFYFGNDPRQLWAGLNLLEAILPLIVFASRSRVVQATVTIVSVPAYVVILMVLTDDSFDPLIRYPL